jgi:predicted flap endonuclease-1-like 5' DNA nuclease
VLVGGLILCRCGIAILCENIAAGAHPDLVTMGALFTDKGVLNVESSSASGVWVFIALILGFIIGFVVAWFIYRNKTQQLTQEAASLQARLNECKAASAEASKRAEVAEESAQEARAIAKASSARASAAALAVPAADKAPAKAAAKAPAAKKAPAKKAPAKKAPAAKAARVAAVPVDTAAAASVLGRKIKADDLTVVEGIGPKIADLLKADGIATWAALEAADVARLQGVLDAAGPRYRVHKPTTWPQQAGLLAAGKWEAFKKLTDELTGGR